jgi:hypothetical protein
MIIWKLFQIRLKRLTLFNMGAILYYLVFRFTFAAIILATENVKHKYKIFISIVIQIVAHAEIMSK